MSGLFAGSPIYLLQHSYRFPTTSCSTFASRFQRFLYALPTSVYFYLEGIRGSATSLLVSSLAGFSASLLFPYLSVGMRPAAATFPALFKLIEVY